MMTFIDNHKSTLKIWKMLLRILYYAGVKFKINGTRLSPELLKTVAYRLKSMYAFLRHPDSMFVFREVKKATAKNMAKASRDICICTDSMMSQILEFKHMKLINKDTVKAFGVLATNYLNAYREVNILSKLKATATDIMETVRTIYLSEEILLPDYYPDMAFNHHVMVQKLRVDYSEFARPWELKTFDETVETILQSQRIIQDIDSIYRIHSDIFTDKTNEKLKRLHDLFTAANGPGSLDQFEKRWQTIKANKRFDAMQLELNADFMHRLFELKKKTQNAVIQIKNSTEEEVVVVGEEGAQDVEKENCLRQLDIVFPGIKLTDDRKNIIWRNFKRDISKSYFILNRIRMNLDVGISTQEDKVLKPDNCIFARFGIDVVHLLPSNDNTTTTPLPQVQGFLAKAVLNKVGFNYKSTELLLFTHPTTNTTTVFDLGDDFPQFRNCKMVWLMHHGLQSMAIVQTHFSTYMIFSEMFSAYNHNNKNSMRLSVANKTVRFTTTTTTTEHKNHPTETSSSSGIAIVELKLCACCGKSAEQKCAHCWNTSKIPIRYCSKDCVVNDRPRHTLVCGSDFSHSWKPAFF